MAAITTRTTADYVTGTGNITATTSSASVTGSGTSFTTEVVAGQILANSSGTVIGTVFQVNSNTSITLTANASSAISGAAFRIVSTGITTKSSPLTNAEIDANFININNAVVAGSNATPDNVAGAGVKRDTSGNFAANQITANSFVTGTTTGPLANASQAEMEAGTQTATRFMSPNNVKQAIDILAMGTIGNVGKDLTGFVSGSTSTLSWNDGLRQLTLTPVGTCPVYYRGVKTDITSAKTVVIPNTNGGVWIYYNTATNALATSTSEDTVFDQIIVSYVYWNVTTQSAVIVSDERHRSSRDTDAHRYNHYNHGMKWITNGEMTYTLNNASATTFALTAPIGLNDEDLSYNVSHNSSPTGFYSQILVGSASMPTLYLDGTTYRATSDSTTPWVAGTTTARYNPLVGSSGSITDAGEGRYINYWIIATNDMRRPIKALMGHLSHTTYNSAITEKFTAPSLPYEQIAPMYQVVLRTSTTYAGNRVQLITVRKIKESAAPIKTDFDVADHGQLANLDADHHTQYLHLTSSRTVTANHTFNGNNTFGGTNTFNSTVTFGQRINSNLLPNASSTYDLGSTTYPWRNIYTNDLHLSNEGHEFGNDVDGTRGNWTVQEGETDLYIINNKSGKKYKFSLEEV